MRWLAAALLLLGVRGAVHAQLPAFDDSGVRLAYSPEGLWRSESGAFVGTREGRRLVLIYDFLDAETSAGRYASCPSIRGDAARAPSCARYQAEVDSIFETWSKAAGVLLVRRRASASETVNIWVAWTTAFKRKLDVGLAIDNGVDPNVREPAGDELFSGFAKPAYPGKKKSSAGLVFNDSFCWTVPGQEACPPPVQVNEYKSVSNTHDVRQIGLHEAGHVLGFKHFTRDGSIMLASSSETSLSSYDMKAARLLYAMVAKSLSSK